MIQIKPLLTLGFDRDAYIPPPYRAWCHRCKIGFLSLEECMDHVKEKHQLQGGK